MKKLSSIILLTGTIILVLVGCKSQKSEHEKMVEFGEKYTSAWNSKKPEKMASFYAEDGSLTVNNGTPAIGRIQLATTANSYMEAFPDMKLTMDSLVVDADTYRYHWTFSGTNTGPAGTGNKVIFSGFEQWTMNDGGLIQKSIGTYDSEDYNRQLIGYSESDVQKEKELRKVVQKVWQDANQSNIQSLKSAHLNSPKFSKFGPRIGRRQDVTSTNASESEHFLLMNDASLEIEDLKVDVFDDVGIATFYNNYDFMKNENHVKGVGRVTLVFYKTKEGWKIVHEHSSPFNG